MKFFKRVLSFTIVTAIALNTAHAQMHEALKDAGENVEALKPVERIYINKHTDEKGNLIRYDSVHTWSYRSGEAAANALKGFDRVWLDKWHKQHSAIYRALPGTSPWVSYEKMRSDFMRTILEMQQGMIKALQQPFGWSWGATPPTKASTKKTPASSKGVNTKTT